MLIYHCIKDMKACYWDIRFALDSEIGFILFISDSIKLSFIYLQNLHVPVIFLPSSSEAVQLYLAKVYVKKKRHTDFQATWKITKKQFMFPALYSSLGLTPTLEIKPNIMAIGGPFPDAQYVPQSGTSISTARVSGMVALFLEHRRKKDPSYLDKKEIFRSAMNTALPYVYHPEHVPFTEEFNAFRQENEEFKGLAASVLWQGAGLIQSYRMIKTKVMVKPYKLELGYTNKLPASLQKAVRKRKLVLFNRGKQKVTYTLSHLPAVALKTNAKNTESTFNIEKKALRVSFWNMKKKPVKKLIIKPGKKAILQVTFYLPSVKNQEHTMNDLISNFVYVSGYLSFLPQHSSETNLENDAKRSKISRSRYGALHS
ncbi:hypothetical protein HMI55_004669 [Coelomomyces lativittatus]|nr:hypothetical protein HMI55_004669 [Coelomomyces lativittatus]